MRAIIEWDAAPGSSKQFKTNYNYEILWNNYVSDWYLWDVIIPIHIIKAPISYYVLFRHV